VPKTTILAPQRGRDRTPGHFRNSAWPWPATHPGQPCPRSRRPRVTYDYWMFRGPCGTAANPELHVTLDWACDDGRGRFRYGAGSLKRPGPATASCHGRPTSPRTTRSCSSGAPAPFWRVYLREGLRRGRFRREGKPTITGSSTADGHVQHRQPDPARHGRAQLELSKPLRESHVHPSTPARSAKHTTTQLFWTFVAVCPRRARPAPSRTARGQARAFDCQTADPGLKG